LTKVERCASGTIFVLLVTRIYPASQS